MTVPLTKPADAARNDAGPRPGAPEKHLSPARLLVGRTLGPVLAIAVYLLLPADPGLSPEARITAAVAVLVATWWMTEALPLAVTALIPIVAFPLAGVLSVNDATAPFASPTVFLFLGGFMIAIAMQRWNLHKRIALLVMRAIGTKPRQLVLGVMIATAFLSMWVSNTATTLMMLPIGVSVLALIASHRPDDSDGTDTDGTDTEGDERDAVTALLANRETRNFAVCLMLSIAFAATIGGLATLIGSPPNLILAGYASESLGITIGFADWMKVGVPLSAVFLVLAWLLLTRVIFPTRLTNIVGGREVLDAELAALGRMSAGERIVAVVFALTATLWILRSPLTDWGILPDTIDDTVIAIAAAVALFLIPADRQDGRFRMTLDWRSVQSGVPWGVLLLFGGGLSLARAMQDTGLGDYIGSTMSGIGVLPIVLVIAAVCLAILGLTEMTSNTATAATFLPVLAGVALSIGVDPMLLLVPAALAATCSFMLPVGTPPNAIVFGSGYVTMGQMVRAGVWLNLLGVILITGAVLALGGWALDIAL